MTENSNKMVEEDIVPLREKLAYGFGQMPGTFFGGVMGVIQSFYYGWMGLQMGWIVIAQVIYAAWNMINDPVFGTMIHNTKRTNKKGETQR